MWAAILGLAPGLKIGYAAIFASVFAIGGWTITILSQVSDVGVVTDNVGVGTIVPASALTVVAGALVYVVRLIANGSLVHRDPVNAELRETERQKQLVEALADMTKALEAGSKREEVFLGFLQREQRQ